MSVQCSVDLNPVPQATRCRSETLSVEQKNPANLTDEREDNVVGNYRRRNFMHTFESPHEPNREVQTAFY